MGNLARVVVVGLDSADKDLIDRWVAEGALPNFARLRDRSVQGDIENPLGMEAGSCWPTFYYGVSPAKHGQYDGTRYYDAKSYRDSKYTAEMLAPNPIWQVVSDAGQRVAVIDAPYRYTAERINGIDVHDWGPHAPTGKDSFARLHTNPDELAGEIEARFGSDPLGGAMCDKFGPRTLKEQREFLENMLDRTRRKADMSIHFLKQGNWDLYLTCFSECHCIGHHAWHIHDVAHPDHDSDIRAKIGDPLKAVYVAIDEAVGRVLECVDETTPVIVYCSHGIGPRYSGTRLLDKVLVKLEGGTPRERSDPLTRTLRAAWRSLPVGLRNTLKPGQAKLYKRLYHGGFAGNRASRKCFEVLVNDGTAGIRVNLAGREASGIVQPGTECDALCESLTKSLSKIVDLETGRPLIKEVHRTNEIHEGARIDDLPDLLVSWNRSDRNRLGRLSRISSPEIGDMEHENLSFRTGDHLPVGRFYAVGPGITAPVDLGKVSVMDFAPTITTLLGIAHPGSDGRPITAVTDAARARPD